MFPGDFDGAEVLEDKLRIPPKNFTVMGKSLPVNSRKKSTIYYWTRPIISGHE